MSTSSATSLLLLEADPQPLVAAVLNADATATTYLLNCKPGTDSNDCGTYNESITLGPWAQPTPPPGTPRTGVYDMHVVEPGEFTLSLHCLMSGTSARECTSINIGGNNDGTPTATITSPATDDFAFAYVPVTITSGLDRLASARDHQPTGTTTGDETATTASGSADSATTSNPANGTGFPGTPTVALFSLFIAWLFR